MENEIWSTFSTLRISSAVDGLTGIFAIWLAARITKVAIDRGANMVAKILLSIFAVCAITINGIFLMLAQSVFINTSKAFSGIKDAGTAISLSAENFITTYSANEPGLINTPVFSLFLVIALVIILLPIWVPAKR
ncbi:hypothetical protein N9842_01170 [Porticoccaceae bacterium]|nr:hypothetical protein [Porticoccaceae bacterium]MDB4262794.1 hypothetical protein [Porticoccaceae bacterium]MDB4308877.1 hypothetical protein [Porticoccaceae bacterium]MDC0004232.1 hypothetical protein [Porticoccaceae bacterium]